MKKTKKFGKKPNGKPKGKKPTGVLPPEIMAKYDRSKLSNNKEGDVAPLNPDTSKFNPNITPNESGYPINPNRFGTKGYDEFNANNANPDTKLNNYKYRMNRAMEGMGQVEIGADQALRNERGNAFSEQPGNFEDAGIASTFAKGGKIRIKPENRGKFNDTNKAYSGGMIPKAFAGINIGSMFKGGASEGNWKQDKNGNYFRKKGGFLGIGGEKEIRHDIRSDQQRTMDNARYKTALAEQSSMANSMMYKYGGKIPKARAGARTFATKNGRQGNNTYSIGWDKTDSENRNENLGQAMGIANSALSIGSALGIGKGETPGTPPSTRPEPVMEGVDEGAFNGPGFKRGGKIAKNKAKVRFKKKKK